jgi:hypothetical protein
MFSDGHAPEECISLRNRYLRKLTRLVQISTVWHAMIMLVYDMYCSLKWLWITMIVIKVNGALAFNTVGYTLILIYFYSLARQQQL